MTPRYSKVLTLSTTAPSIVRGVKLRHCFLIQSTTSSIVLSSFSKRRLMTGLPLLSGWPSHHCRSSQSLLCHQQTWQWNWSCSWPHGRGCTGSTMGVKYTALRGILFLFLPLVKGPARLPCLCHSPDSWNDLQSLSAAAASHSTKTHDTTSLCWFHS